MNIQDNNPKDYIVFLKNIHVEKMIELPLVD